MDRTVGAGSERREDPRRSTGDWTWEPQVTLRCGQRATVVNWSRVGLLVESSWRLAPGARITLCLRGLDGDLTLHGRIVWAIVSGITAHAGVCYHAGIQVDAPIVARLEIAARDGNQIPNDGSHAGRTGT